MGRRIRWLGIVMILCLGLVIVQLTNIQFRRSSTLAHSADNPVNRVPDFNNDRGEIFAADGTPLAYSVRIAAKGSGTYEFQRVYPTGSLFSSPKLSGCARPTRRRRPTGSAAISG